MLGEVCRWNDVSSTVSMATGLGGVVQQDLNIERMHDDGCKHGSGTIQGWSQRNNVPNACSTLQLLINIIRPP
jgi:hypothetical protein